MKLALSVRIGEYSDRKDVTALPIEQLAPLAKACGFDGLCLRASVLSIASPLERIDQIKRLLDAQGLAVSMVTGDIAIAANSGPEAAAPQRNITPYLDLTERLGAHLHRIMMRSPADLPWTQRAADEAAERGITLAHQLHWGTFCETVDDALETVRLVNRPRAFGLTFEPANLLLCGDVHGAEAVERLAPHLVNVYFQNIRLDPSSPTFWPSFRRGPVHYRYIGLDDKRGCDLEAIVRALKQLGYDGWFTVHQPLQPGQEVEQAVRESAAACLRYL
jgi:sugar phosphate isomerase/epimerase